MRSVLHHRDSVGTGRINMTPMIDVTFLLLTFFMFASHFASAEKLELDLPAPDNSQAQDRRFKEKIIINVVYTGPHAEPAYLLGPLSVRSLTALGDRLQNIGEQNPRLEVILRADRRLPYGDVREVMEMIAATGLTRLQVVTEMD